MEGYDQTVSSVVLHLEVHGGGYCDQLSESWSPKDALVKRWEIYYQKLGFDGSGRHSSLEGDNQLDVSPKFYTGPVEALEI